MRLWSVHPALLDTDALEACWRDGQLAQAVLRGDEKGYRHHPQLVRFRSLGDPVTGISTYLHAVADEGETRRLAFDRDEIVARRNPELTLDLATGQLEYEWRNLLVRLAEVDPERFARQRDGHGQQHPMFRLVPGDVEPWEREHAQLAAEAAARREAQS